MKRIILSFLVFIFICFWGCTNPKMNRNLVLADSLLSHDDVDSALCILENVVSTKLKGDEEQANYTLLLTEARYRANKPSLPDSVVDNCISFYKKDGNPEQLARAFYYKGVANFENGYNNVCIRCLKESEMLLSEFCNEALKHKIIEGIAYTNLSDNETSVAIEYAFKDLKHAKVNKNADWMATAYNCLASCYRILGKPDSSCFYINKCIPILGGVKESHIAQIMNSIYVLKNDIAEKKLIDYLEKATAHKHNFGGCYSNLAYYYHRIGNEQKSKMLWKKAFAFKEARYRVGVLTNYMLQKRFDNDIEGENAVARELATLTDSMNHIMRQNQVRTIEYEYDKKRETSRWFGYIGIVMGTTGVVLLLVLLVAWYNRRKYKFWFSKCMRDGEEIKHLNKEMEILRADGDENLQKVKELSKTISKIEKRRDALLHRGQELYRKIHSGETVVLWTQRDFTDFTRYYIAIDIAFMHEMQQKYDGLSPKNIFFLILQHEGFSDADVMRVMGISESTIRSTKSRIRNKAKAAGT